LLSRPVSDALAALLLSPPLRTSISPPFPYTTLFRSDDRGGAHRGAQPAVPELDGDPGARGTGGACGRTQRVRDPARRPDTARREDRKSTRLNSSHVKISYAVFCLKKKSATMLLICGD